MAAPPPSAPTPDPRSALTVCAYVGSVLPSLLLVVWCGVPSSLDVRSLAAIFFALCLSAEKVLVGRKGAARRTDRRRTQPNESATERETHRQTTSTSAQPSPEHEWEACVRIGPPFAGSSLTVAAWFALPSLQISSQPPPTMCKRVQCEKCSKPVRREGGRRPSPFPGGCAGRCLFLTPSSAAPLRPVLQTWAGCGQHIETALAGVPVADRCSCPRGGAAAACAPQPTATPAK